VISRIAALLDRALRLAAVGLLLALLGCVVIGVVSRLIGQPVAWSDETAQYLMVWVGFTGMMIAARRRSHIRITVFLDRLPTALRTGLELLIQCAVIGFAAALIRYGWPLIIRNWDIEWVSLALPAGLLYLPVPFAAAVLIGQALAAMADAWRGRIPPLSSSGEQPL
jgi:TRAP-type transport system small permease protein